MIKIDRGDRPADIKIYTERAKKALDGVTLVTRAELELEEAVRYCTDPANYSGGKRQEGVKGFKFKLYKNPELVAALERIFGTKCAYCESHFAHVTPGDIEHFRPKAEIEASKDLIKAPGYFWIAAEWDNLLVSCPGCNRGKNYEVPGQPKKIKLGKESQFPLANEKKRVEYPGELKKEESARLLINPCIDDPEDYLWFDDAGRIHARTDENGKESAKGNTSIHVYALQRKALVERRLVALENLKSKAGQLGDLLKNRNVLVRLGASQAELDESKRQIYALRDEIRNLLAPSREYLAMLRGWIRDADARGEFKLLRQFGIDLVRLIDPKP